MKLLLLTSLILLSTFNSALACGGKNDTMINNNLIYAEVISLNQFTLEFVLKVKDISKEIRVLGGQNYNLKNLPNCADKTAKEVKLNWLNNTTAEYQTFDSNHHTAAYRVCISSKFGNGKIKSYSVCNYEVGD